MCRHCSVSSTPLSPRCHFLPSCLRPAPARCGATCEATLPLRSPSSLRHPGPFLPLVCSSSLTLLCPSSQATGSLAFCLSVPVLPLSPLACTVQSNVRGNPPTPSVPFCPLVSWSLPLPRSLRARCKAMCEATLPLFPFLSALRCLGPPLPLRCPTCTFPLVPPLCTMHFKTRDTVRTSLCTTGCEALRTPLTLTARCTHVLVMCCPCCTAPPRLLAAAARCRHSPRRSHCSRGPCQMSRGARPWQAPPAPQPGFHCTPAAPGRRGVSITISCKSRKKIDTQKYNINNICIYMYIYIYIYVYIYIYIYIYPLIYSPLPTSRWLNIMALRYVPGHKLPPVTESKRAENWLMASVLASRMVWDHFWKNAFLPLDLF